MSRTRLLGRAEDRTDPRPADDLRPIIPAGVAPGGAPVPRGIRVRHQVAGARLYLPALTAFVATFWIGGLDGSAAALAIAFALATVVVARLLRDFPYPLPLLPASRLAIAILPVATGAIGASALILTDASALPASDLALAFAVAAVVAVTVEILGALYIGSRPMRIAVLGSADFVPAIRRELDAIG